MTKFREDITSIARERHKDRLDREQGRVSIQDTETNDDVKEAMSRLLYLADLGVKTYNESLGDKELSMYELPKELLKVFFNLPGEPTGFCVTAPQKFVVFLDQEPDEVLVLGKKMQNEMGSGNGIIGARQLIRITFYSSDDSLVFKDNTGATLDIEDIVTHIIKWLVSE